MITEKQTNIINKIINNVGKEYVENQLKYTYGYDANINNLTKKQAQKFIEDFIYLANKPIKNVFGRDFNIIK